MTPSQLDDSLKAPWTRTIVGFSLVWAWLGAAAISTALAGKAAINNVFLRLFMFPPMEIEFGDAIWPRAPRMPNVARWFFKRFRQLDILIDQEIRLRQEKS